MSVTTQEKMHALRMHEPGNLDSITNEEAGMPSPAVGDVLVQVHAASVTPTELDWPSTWNDRSGRDRRPVVPGHEMFGVVVDLGFGRRASPPATRFWV